MLCLLKYRKEKPIYKFLQLKYYYNANIILTLIYSYAILKLEIHGNDVLDSKKRRKNTMRQVYLDNAATSRPKPPAVWEAMENYMKNIGCSPGRGGYECSLEAGRILLETRVLLKDFFNIPSPEQVIFTQNITHSLNMALKGLLKKGDHVITSSMEHNSVVRPLRNLEKTKGIEVDFVKCDEKGLLNPQLVKDKIKHNTKMIVLTHASNVTGTLMPVEEIGEIANEEGLLYVLDTAQTAGVYEIDFENLGLDVLAFTGHKSLMGPPGIGGLCISRRAAEQMEPLIEGGTGSRSDMEYQPDMLPDKFESGTMNTVGIAGLNAGLKFINKTGLQNIRNHEKQLTERFLEGLKKLPGIIVYGPGDPELQTSTISISIKGLDMGELSFMLDYQYGVMTRSGLHCAPLAHKTIGSFPEGTLRFSIGYFNTTDEIDYTLRSLKEIIDYNLS
ncbi:MAG: hypothetical protein PWQ82_531 [Thermosediminibacterales bacterium]|nr:hypothetical protein [Thermosediminibacterales bacterium]